MRLPYRIHFLINSVHAGIIPLFLFDEPVERDEIGVSMIEEPGYAEVIHMNAVDLSVLQFYRVRQEQAEVAVAEKTQFVL